MVYLFPRAAVRKYYKLGGLKQQIYSLVVLEAGSQNQGVNMATFPPSALRKNVFFLASSGCWLAWESFGL